MAKVNSRDPKHRATIARQQAARRKKPVSGRLKTTFRTQSGRQMANPSRTRSKVVTVVDWKGNKYKTKDDLARKMIKSGEIPLQELK